jgi:2-phosphosulfolactate phosphatase
VIARQIHVADFTSGAEAARGTVVVIDVFRACSLIAHALAAGATRVIPVSTIDTARALKAQWPDALLVGERYARPLPGFDCGNSPTEVLAQPLQGRTLIHTTHAGTQGLTAAARRADRVFTGALVNLSATVAAIGDLAPSEVTIVAMGHEARERCTEDDLCRDQFVTALSCTTHEARAQLRSAPAADKFFDPQADWAPESDFDLCTAVDSVSFAILMQPASAEEQSLVSQTESLWELRPWPAPSPSPSLGAPRGASRGPSP